MYFAAISPELSHYLTISQRAHWGHWSLYQNTQLPITPINKTQSSDCKVVYLIIVKVKSPIYRYPRFSGSRVTLGNWKHWWKVGVSVDFLSFSVGFLSFSGFHAFDLFGIYSFSSSRLFNHELTQLSTSPFTSLPSYSYLCQSPLHALYQHLPRGADRSLCQYSRIVLLRCMLQFI